MPRKPQRRILPFRIPFFRIFYSTTYTTIYIITLCFLVITPGSMIYQAINQRALQYVVMIGGTYVLTASLAIFIYASRLYTNRTITAGVGKNYVPIEPGEVGKNVRKMIVKQFERSATVAWESRPRDLLGEILEAEHVGVLAPETPSVNHNDYTVGKEIPIDPAAPPWGDVRHDGWASPARRDDGHLPSIQFAPVIEELPNLIEAKAVSLAPPDPLAIDQALADPVILEVLQRPETMGLRDYLMQLSYLGLINPPEAGEAFLTQYEDARFGGLPTSEAEFKNLMAVFADLLAGMHRLEPAFIDQIRIQAGDRVSLMDADERSPDTPELPLIRSSSPLTPDSIMMAPVAAPSAPAQGVAFRSSRASDSRTYPDSRTEQTPASAVQSSPLTMERSPSVASSSLISEQSDTGSVLRYRSSRENG